MEFLIENYIWFGIAGVIILMALVGFIAEKTNFIKNSKENKIAKKELKKKNKDEKNAAKVELIEQTDSSEEKQINSVTEELVPGTSYSEEQVPFIVSENKDDISALNKNEIFSIEEDKSILRDNLEKNDYLVDDVKDENGLDLSILNASDTNDTSDTYIESNEASIPENIEFNNNLVSNSEELPDTNIENNISEPVVQSDDLLSLNPKIEEVVIDNNQTNDDLSDIFNVELPLINQDMNLEQDDENVLLTENLNQNDSNLNLNSSESIEEVDFMSFPSVDNTLLDTDENLNFNLNQVPSDSISFVSELSENVEPVLKSAPLLDAIPSEESRNVTLYSGNISEQPFSPVQLTTNKSVKSGEDGIEILDLDEK